MSQDLNPGIFATRPKVKRFLQGGVVAVLLMLFAAISWHSRRPLSIRGSDGLVYVALSESLEHGTYRDTYLAGEPLHRKYPPFYPLWLIPLRHLDDSYDGIRLANIGAMMAAFLLVFAVSRRLLRPWLAAGAVSLLVTTPVLQDWSTSILSDSLFTALTIGSLAAAYRAELKTRTALPAIILAWLAFLTRTAGIALLAGLAVWLWQRRRRPELAVFLAGSLVVVGGWLTYANLAPGGETSVSYGLDVAAMGSKAEGDRLSPIIAQSFRNGVEYATEYLPFSMSLPTLEGTLVDNIAWLIAMIGLLIPGLIALWREWRSAAAFIVLYLAMLALWPWPYERFLLPVLPLILVCMLKGAEVLVRPLRPERGRWVLVGLVGLMAIGTIRGTRALWAARALCDRADPLHSAGCYQPEILSLVRGIEYVGAETAPEDIVMTSETPTVHHLTGRKTLPSRLLHDLPPGRAAEHLKALNVRFMLLSSVRPADRGPISAALLASCQGLRLAAAFHPHTLVLETAQSPDPRPEACDALAEFRENMRAYGDRDP